MSGPVAHLRVIDAAEALPGAIATMLLADHGADHPDFTHHDAVTVKIGISFSPDRP